MINPQYFVIGAEVLESLFKLILQGSHANISHEAINNHLMQVKNSLQPYELPAPQETNQGDQHV